MKAYEYTQIMQEQILKCISNVHQDIKDVTFDDFVSDSTRYYAVMKNIEII